MMRKRLLHLMNELNLSSSIGLLERKNHMRDLMNVFEDYIQDCSFGFPVCHCSYPAGNDVFGSSGEKLLEHEEWVKEFFNESIEGKNEQVDEELSVVENENVVTATIGDESNNVVGEAEVVAEDEVKDDEGAKKQVKAPIRYKKVVSFVNNNGRMESKEIVEDGDDKREVYSRKIGDKKMTIAKKIKEGKEEVMKKVENVKNEEEFNEIWSKEEDGVFEKKEIKDQDEKEKIQMEGTKEDEADI